MGSSWVDCVGVIALATFFAGTVLGSLLIGAVSPAVGVGVISLSLILTGIYYFVLLTTLDPPISTRGRTLSLIERMALYSGALARTECGCLYDPHAWGVDPPSRKATAESPDAEREWVVEQTGARVTYRLYKIQMKRCVNCGSFVHDKTEYDEYGARHTVWIDEPLPDAVADSGYEITDAEVFDNG